MDAQPDRSFDGLRKAAIDLLPAIEADADEAEDGSTTRPTGSPTRCGRRGSTPS